MRLEDSDFADDLVLLSHTHQQMQVKTTNAATASELAGFNIHKGKTKIRKYNTMNINQSNHLLTPVTPHEGA
ncbi:unnamed protein product [Schistosoma mattheei]|uniref:Uncharacterized protein n=1 Tax=Schistosoma mattheei TaxID=31246 RepID=A0A183Q6H2_9TREM|nr:unnamed protein product [Schistosoma mattheei]